MNKVFKVIWNEARNAYVVVSEIAKNRGSKSCSTKKLLAMLIAMGVMTCASFDVLAAPPSVAATAKSQYVAFFDETAGLINGQEDTIDGHKYIYDATNKYWVRAGYKLTVEENGKLHTPLSAHGKAADVAYIGDGDTGSILQSVTSMVSASGTVTNMGESLSRITASAFAGVSHGGGAAVAGDWSYIIQDSSWQGYENYQDGYVDLIDQANGMPKGFVTVGEKLKWDDTKQAYTYNGKPVDYSNVYVIDGKIGVFTNQSGSDFYKGTVFGKNNEILMTVKDGDHFYSYWAAEVTDPSATMQSYRLAEYKKDLAVLVENDNKLSRDDIKEVTLDTSKANSATISLLRNGDKAVDGAITVTSGGGTEGSDTFVKISNGTANQTFATGSKVEAIGTTEATTGIKINGQEYTIKSGSVVSVAKDAANKTTTITVDGNATTITDTDTTYTAGDGIKINVGAISVSKNLTGMQSIQGAGEGKISFDGANVKVNNTTFSENSVVVGGGTDGKTPVTINGTDGVVSGLHNTNIGYTDFATRGNAATEEQLKKVMDAGWKFTTDSGTKTTVTVGEAGNEVKFNGDSANIEVTNTGNNIKVALNKNLTVDSVKAGSSFMSATGIGYGDKAYITSSGLNANGQTITNVKAGEAETDAVNVGQLNAVKAEASKKTTLSNGKNTTVTSVTTDGQTDYKVNVAGNLKDITSVANGASEIKLNADSIIIANTNKTFAITNSGIGMSYVASDYSTKAIMLGENGTTISGGLNVAGSKITGVAAGTIAAGSTDAVNGSQLQETNNKVDNLKTEVGKGWVVATENGTATKVGAGDTVDFSGADNNIKVSNDGTNVKVALNKELTGLTSVTTNNAYVTNVDNNNNNSVTNVQYVNEQIAGVTLTAGDGISISEKKIKVNLKDGEQNLVVNSNGLALNTALTGIQSITDAGAGSISFADGGIKLNNKVTIDNNGKISGVADGVNANDAVNVSQLNKVNAEAGKHTTLIDGKNTKVEETTNAYGGKEYKVNVDLNGYAKTDDVAVVYVDNDKNKSLHTTNSGTVGNNSIALGKKAIASNDSIAIGDNSHAGNKGTVLGTKAQSIREGATVVGYNANSYGLYSTVVGTNATINSNGKTVYGKIVQGAAATLVGAMNTVDNKDGEEYSGVANNIMGAANTITASNGVTIQGSGNTVTDAYKDMKISLSDGLAILGGDYSVLAKKESGAVAVVGGANTVSKQTSTTVIGYGNTVKGDNTTSGVLVAGTKNNLTNVSASLIMGDNNTLNNRENVILLGNGNSITANNAVAIGNGAGVSEDGGVALGVGSVASTAAGVLGFGADGQEDAIWKATKGAVSVGGNGETRQITNVAAGTADTDAVNVAQLKTAKTEVQAGANTSVVKDTGANGQDIYTINAKDTTYAAGNGITISGENNEISVKVKAGENNIQVTDAGLELKKDLTVDSVKAGSSFMSATGIGYGDKAYITSSGLNANNQKITGVADGTDDTDAVNVGQLKTVSEVANQGWKLSTNGDAASKVAPGEIVDFSGDKNISVSHNGTKVKVELNDELEDIKSISNGDSRINLNADSISISNGNKSFAITNSGIGMSYITADYSAKSIMLGENGTTISGGLNVAGSKITGVAAGTIAAGSTDAVNGSQLNDIKNSINTDISNKTFGLKDDKGSEVTSTLGNTVQVKGADGITSTVKDGALEIGLKLQDNSNLVVNSNGLALNTALTGIQSINGTGAGSISFNGGNVKVNQNTFNSDGRIQNVANGTEMKDAVNFGQLDATNKKVDNLTNEVGKGWTVETENGTATKVGAGDTVKFSGDDNIKVSNTGKDVKVELNKKLTVDSVKAGDFFMDKNEGVGYKGKAYITSSGLNANGQTITNVKAGEAETDAVNVGQLNAVKAEASKKTTLSDGKNTTVTSVTTDGQTDYQVNVAGDLKDITSVSNGASKINLNADSISISNANKSFAITNSGIGMSYIGADYTAKSIMLGENGTTISGGLNVAGSKITGVAAGTADTDAVNVGQLNAVKETANKGWKLKTNNGNVSDVKPGDEVEFDGDDNIKVSNAGNKVSFKLNNKLTGIESITGVGGGSISFSGGNVTINNNVTFGSNGQIHNVTAGTASTDAVNVGQLNAAVQAGNTDTHIKPGEYGVGADNKVNMDVVDKTGTKINTVTITDVAKASDLGNVNNINNDLKNSNGTTTVVDAVNNLNQKLDNKVGDLQYSKVDKGDIADGDSTTTAIGKLDQKLNDVAATAAKQHTTVSGSGNIVVEDPTINADGGKNYNVKLADDINVNSVTANTFKADKTIMDKDGLKVGEKVSVTENAVTAGKTSISDEGVKVGDKTYISDKGLNANGQNITNVADGKVEKDSKDAINGGQLFDTETKINNRIDGVENQVISNSNRIGQLSSRVNKVGAGAAALAALHPMDFDPDDKLTFSAGYGNYAGQNAAAIGAYYRPDEKVMFSVGGTVGNGENMVNAGISFSLDRTNHVSNSRTALAREVIDLRGQLAEMGAKMAKMEKAFGMLDESKTKLFPDIPANHWAYEYIAKLAGNGYVEGYPDGSFGGDRLMTRYEFAAMLYRAIENGAALEEKIIKEFEPELGRIRVDRISGEDGDRDKIERVRVNDTKGERDHYGNKLAK